MPNVCTICLLLGFLAPSDELAKARTAFFELDRIAKLPEAEQRAAIGRCYELTVDLIPQLYSNIARFDRADAKGTAEETARALEKAGGWTELHSAARRQCLELLKTHSKATQALVAADFASADDVRVKRALEVVSELRLTGFFDDVLKVFQGNSPSTQRAVYVLRDLRDPRAIEPIIARDPQRPTQYFELLRNLCRSHAASPTLVKLFDSEDPRVRWQAVYALAECGDDTLAPKVEKLFADVDPQVRQSAGDLAANLSDEAFRKLRPGLLTLLNDADRQVRFNTALVFASRRQDKAAAPALLALLREGKLERGYHSTAVQAMHTLTLSYFGYKLDEPPGSAANAAAMDAFASWIEKSGR